MDQLRSYFCSRCNLVSAYREDQLLENVPKLAGSLGYIFEKACFLASTNGSSGEKYDSISLGAELDLRSS